MKKGIGILLLILILTFSACGKNVDIKEKVLTMDDGSTIYYPVVQTGNPGATKAINKEIENVVFKREGSGVLNQGYTAVQNKELLSVFIEGATDTESYIKTLHINTKTGKRYGLYDLVMSEKKEELEKIVDEELNNRLVEFNLVYKPNIDSAAFDAFDNRLVFIFNPGEIAPADMGFIDIALEFDRIDHILNKSGEFYQIVNKE